MGDSISEGVVQSFEAPVGTLVKADDLIARIETDKVTVDIMAAFDGVITKYHAEEGDTVPVGAPFCDIDPDAKPAAGGAAPAKEAAPEPTKAPEPVKAAEPAKQAPAAPVAPPKAAPAPPKTTAAPSSAPNMTTVLSKKAPSEIGGQRLETRVPMSRMRQTISRRLKES